MSTRQLYTLTIPLADLSGCRMLAQLILRQRSLGPIVVRDKTYDPQTPGVAFIGVMAIQAIFADLTTLNRVEAELQQALPRTAMRIRSERRRVHGSDEPPCSCVLWGVEDGRPWYLHQEMCLRHSRIRERTRPASQTPVPAVGRARPFPGWTIIAPREGEHARRQSLEQYPSTFIGTKYHSAEREG